MSAFKKAGIPRAGFDYQDLLGVQVLVDFYQDRDLYEWVELESDSTSDGVSFSALDDIVAKRRHDGRYIVRQVKFTVDSERDDLTLSFRWLLERRGKRGTSLIQKWASTVLPLIADDLLAEAALWTNRRPDAEVAAALDDGRLVPDRIAAARWREIVDHVGSDDTARLFLTHFRFRHSLPESEDLELRLRGRLIPDYTDMSGWLYLLAEVRKWATLRREPGPDGRVTYEVLRHVLHLKRPKPLSQDFVVPEGYRPPDATFDQRLMERVRQPSLTVVWGSPGRGKSTYLSYASGRMREQNTPVLRHHYFLSISDLGPDRLDFVTIAESLLHQMRRICPDVLGEHEGRPDELRDRLDACGRWYGERGKSLVVIIDGLDHVARERGDISQLNHLFQMLLPLPTNVALVLGTQRVADNQLPSRLRSHREDENEWIELPLMDRSSVASWVWAQAESGRVTLPVGADNEDGRRHVLDQVSEAFYEISAGHPLHLIYSFEFAVRLGNQITDDLVYALPPCPDGDIQRYYASLWGQLSVPAREILHLFAASPFHWPHKGVFECLGSQAEYLAGWSEIEHMIEFRRSGLQPFHGSILVFITENADHPTAAARLMPKILAWLDGGAPPYWRWAWAWLIRAQAGDPEPLIERPSRQWVIESLCSSYPTDQIERILDASERAAFQCGLLARVVELRALKMRVLNGPEFQVDEFHLFTSGALALSHDSAPWDLRIDNLPSLSAPEVATVAELSSPHEPDVAAKCFDELRRRWNYRVEFGGEFHPESGNLAESLVRAAAAAPDVEPRRIVRFAERCERSVFDAHVQELVHLKAMDRLAALWECELQPPLLRGVYLPIPLGIAAPMELVQRENYLAFEIAGEQVGRWIWWHCAWSPGFPSEAKSSIGSALIVHRQLIEQWSRTMKGPPRRLVRLRRLWRSNDHDNYASDPAVVAWLG